MATRLPHDQQPRCTPRPNRIIATLVSLYLFGVGTWLVVTRQIPSPKLWRALFRTLRRPYAGDLSGFAPEAGHCFVASVPPHLLSDHDSVSQLALFEDDLALGAAHSLHDDIRQLGLGRYSHWGANIYFSTSDNSDPRLNGRRYRVREIRR